MTDKTESTEVAAEGGTTPPRTKRSYKKSSKKASKKASKKVAKKSPKSKGGTGKRHSQEVKDKVVAFVKSNPGRGVYKAAMKEFGISYISIRNWLKKEGVQVKKAVKGAVKSIKGKGPGRPKGSVNKASGSGDTLDTLMAAIKAKKTELSDLLKQFEVEARSL